MILAEKSFNRQGAAIGSPDGTLGSGQVIWDRLTGWMTGVGQDEALRRALKDWLEGDKTFDIGDRDDTYKEVTNSVGSGVDFIVTGTHISNAQLKLRRPVLLQLRDVDSPVANDRSDAWGHFFFQARLRCPDQREHECD